MLPTFTRPSVTLEAAKTFLRNRIRSELIGNICFAVTCLLGAALAFALIIWASYIYSIPHHNHMWLWSSLTAIAFSFIAYMRTDSDYIGDLEVGTLGGGPAFHIWIPGGYSLSNINYLDPKTQRSMAKVVLQILVIGPSALFAAWRFAVRTIGVLRVDLDSAAAMFRVLAERGKRVPYHELAGEVPRNPEKSIGDLLLLDVAQHLGSEPQGMVIHSTCREKLTGIKPADF